MVASKMRLGTPNPQWMELDDGLDAMMGAV